MRGIGGKKEWRGIEGSFITHAGNIDVVFRKFSASFREFSASFREFSASFREFSASFPQVFESFSATCLSFVLSLRGIRLLEHYNILTGLITVSLSPSVVPTSSYKEEKHYSILLYPTLSLSIHHPCPGVHHELASLPHP